MTALIYHAQTLSNEDISIRTLEYISIIAEQLEDRHPLGLCMFAIGNVLLLER